MMTGLIWALLIFVLAIALLVLEMFIPSGGLLGLLSAVGFLASLVFVFREDSTLGFVYLLGMAVGLPILLMAMVKYWPYTTLGRMMLNLPPPGTEPEPTFSPVEDLLGRRGTAKSKMLPSGAVVIDGRTYDAVSAGIAIELGDPIEVFRVEGNRITVRPVIADRSSSDDDDETVSGESPMEEGSVDERPASDPSSDILNRTYDDAIPDPFDEPLS